jgi:hypothetical protein
LLRSRKAFQCWFGLHQNLGAGILSLGLYVWTARKGVQW